MIYIREISASFKKLIPLNRFSNIVNKLEGVYKPKFVFNARVHGEECLVLHFNSGEELNSYIRTLSELVTFDKHENPSLDQLMLIIYLSSGDLTITKFLDNFVNQTHKLSLVNQISEFEFKLDDQVISIENFPSKSQCELAVIRQYLLENTEFINETFVLFDKGVLKNSSSEVLFYELQTLTTDVKNWLEC